MKVLATYPVPGSQLIGDIYTVFFVAIYPVFFLSTKFPFSPFCCCCCFLLNLILEQ